MTEATDESVIVDMTEVVSSSSSSEAWGLWFFFQAVLGLSMEPNEPKDESESVSMISKVRSPILEMLLMEDLRSNPPPMKEEPPSPLYIEPQE